MNLDSIAAGLANAWRTGAPYREDFSAVPTEHDAYAIQDRVGDALGWFPDGRARAWKAGGREVLTAAPLPRVLPSGSIWTRTGEAIIIVEAEVSLRLARTPSNADEIESCIGTMCASIEIVSTRLIDGTKAPPMWKLADQQLHACSIIGAEMPYVRRDWTKQRGRLIVNGTAREFQGTHPNGNPAYPVSWLARHAADRGRPLRAGDLVMTGAWLIAEATPGDSVEAQFQDIGSASVRIT